MWEHEATTDITAPVEDVFRYLSDFRRHKEWSRGVDEVTAVGGNGRTDVGSEFEARETVPSTFTSYARITALEPPRRIAWDATDKRMMNTQWSFELSPTGSGARLVQRCRFEPRNIPGRVILSLIRKRQIPKENRQSLERIKAILEGGSV